MRRRRPPARLSLAPLPVPLTNDTLDLWVIEHSGDDALHRRAVLVRLFAGMARGGDVDPVDAVEAWEWLAEGTPG